MRSRDFFIFYVVKNLQKYGFSPSGEIINAIFAALFEEE
jgi:hypothetical protein